MKLNLVFLIVIACLNIHQASGQSEKIIGFWEIESVSVGEKSMTPVAKWTKINSNGTFQSGNGWLQSSAGTWKYDLEHKSFTSIDELGLIDEYGGFQVSFLNDKMIWKREEDGMEVQVNLKAISELPLAPADYFEGMWRIADISKNQLSIIDEEDPEKKHKLHIRWDRLYSNYTTEGGKLTGYWHINSHRPEITMLPHQAEQVAESWKISVNKAELTMTGISESNKGIQRKYRRINTY